MGSVMTRRNKSTIKAVVTALAMVLAFVMSSTAYASATLTKIRVGQTHDKTRVVFDIKHNHRFVISTLKNPSRIVVDFYKTKNKISFDRKSFQDPRLGRIRIKDQKQRVRIVLDLRNNFDYHYFTLGKNKQGAERVVVDVLKKSNSKHIVKKATPKKTIKVAKAKAPVKKVAHKVARNDIANEQNTRHVMNAGSPVFHPEKQDLVIAIDPGHGGKDTGAIGHNHLYEKNVVLKMAKKLKKYIDAQPGMRAVLTRDRDIFIPLHKRVRLAHKMNADIFISIHADSFPDRSARGGSVYVLSTKGASSVMARVLAKSENASLNDIKLKGRDSDVAFVLSDLTREANIRASRKLAKSVLHAMGRSVRLHKSSVQSADFAVLKSIDMPSMLIETAFVSNPTEARNLKSNRFQSKMAKSIAMGITRFVKQNAQEPRWGEKLYVHYRVQKGDTLSEIAANYKVSTHRLKKINHIKEADQLYVGKKLRIPVSENMIATL